MVRKIDGSFYLNRAETIDYLLHAYSLKWCNTRWSSGGTIRISFESSNGALRSIRICAYKTPGSRVVRVKKEELDAYFN